MVLIGGLEIQDDPFARRVDLIDLSTGQVSSLPDMINVVHFSVGVLKRVKELLPPSRWSLLPPMIEERSQCAAVNIPNYGILVIGGVGRNRLPLRSTELLTRLSNEGESGEGEKWQWRHFPPMNYDHCGSPLSVYFQGRVYIVGSGDKVNEMEMLDVAAGGQWTTLTFFRHPLTIQSMATVGKKLFLLVF
ncbi:unnamed protein product [Hymenolepis diminuta]|uniref:Uncharacterized protein n=1 Tax=Hymenolepis diminuta TaxID=6216 RepID=A0A3P7BAN4_HYMDI|nr:unnamed protein product [Hymenolepis diminuta]